MNPTPDSTAASQAPARAGLVLLALILVAAVANLNLSVANVALPEIGRELDASQTGLNLIAVGYSLGLAASVLWFGALGDRFGRKLMLLAGTAVAVPASLLAAFSPGVELLFIARMLGGLAAGMAYPTTLSLITALWSGAARTHAIALWSALGGAISALGPITAGALLGSFAWGSVFLITLPLALVALLLAWRVVPAHINESVEPVDNASGLMSVVLVASFVLALNFAPLPGRGALAAGLALLSLVLLVGFLRRQRRIETPLYDTAIAARRIFWVAAAAGVIVFGSLMAAMFIGQQFLQNVLGWSPLQSGAAILPAVLMMVLVAPRSAGLVERRGARFTLLAGYAFCLAGFLWMLLVWRQGSDWWQVAVAYALVGIGVGFAGTPASHSLTGAVPVRRAGMASATADLQRDLGGAVMQSLLGALLTAGYAKAAAAAIASAPDPSRITDQVQAELTRSFGSAAETASRYPAYSKQIISAAEQSFLQGQHWAYAAGIVAIVLGAGIVAVFYPKHAEERRLLAGYAASDAHASPAGG